MAGHELTPPAAEVLKDMDLSSVIIFIVVMAVFFGWLSFSMPSEWKVWMGYFAMVSALACAIYITGLIHGVKP